MKAAEATALLEAELAEAERLQEEMAQEAPQKGCFFLGGGGVWGLGFKV